MSPKAQSEQYDVVCRDKFDAVMQLMDSRFATLDEKLDMTLSLSRDTYRRMFISNGSKAVIEQQAHHEERIQGLEAVSHPPQTSKKAIVVDLSKIGGGGTLAAGIVWLLIWLLGGQGPAAVSMEDVMSAIVHHRVAVTNSIGIRIPKPEEE